MKIGITGADGLLGFHVRALLHAKGGHQVRLANRATFADPAATDAFVRDLDGLVHLAGMNRGEEAVVEKANITLASDLVAALRRADASPVLVFANSTHFERDTGYGRGKRLAANLLGAWADKAQRPFANLVIPNVFGEFGRPFYNSVVSTFCSQLANGKAPEIHIDAMLELVHAQEVAHECIDALGRTETGTTRLQGKPLTVSELLKRLKVMYEQYLVARVVPDLTDRLSLQLFNTFRSYLYPAHYPVLLDLRTDARGSLFEAVKARQGGQVFLSTTHPGIGRGNHYHLQKVERFLVVSGHAEISIRKLFSAGVTTFQVDGATPCFIDIPTFHTHSITNTGQGDLSTLFWSNEIFDPENPDTYAEAVKP